ncbi:MAG: protein trl [Desulfatitalea sp.]|nr:protein trl [Desulfatitalea sp.]MBI5896595.1 protein trl [Desulfobacterales bacterium]
MRRFKLLKCAAILIAALILSGCAYVHTKTPFDSDLDKTDLGTKVGTADAYSILWLVAWGDASYEAAARNGDIKVLKHADQESLAVLFGLYVRWRVIVYGD